MKADIASGLKDLVSRFRTNPAIPEVPDVYQKGGESIPKDMREPDEYEFLDLEYWLDYYPALDKATAKALLKVSDNDRFPNFYMMAFGNHFVSQSWTDADLKEWYEGMDASPAWPNATTRKKLAPTKRAKILSDLTWEVMNHAMECVHIGHLKHTAGLIENLSLKELNMEAEQTGIEIPDRDNKASLVVALIEHIYSDVIEPKVTA